MDTAVSMTGKVALVTGAAAGLGRATALQLAGAGARVCLVDIDADGLADTHRAISEMSGEALVHAADLADSDNCQRAVSAAVEHFGRLDALCCVAAILVACHAAEMSDAQWEKTMAVNLGAPFRLFRAAIPHLLETHGAVVNVTSCAAAQGQAYTAAYCASKAGLTNLTRALAMEYMNQPVRINAVAPGGMDTALAASFWTLQDADPALIQRYTALRGSIAVEDVAAMIVYLASDAARAIHGASFAVDNGITAG